MVLGSRSEFSVIGFDHEKRVYELYSESFAERPDEEIRHVSFLEDNIPAFLFLVIYNRTTNKSHIKILKMRKNAEFEKALKIKEDGEFNLELTKSVVNKEIKDNYEQGVFKERRKRSFDNVELIPNKPIIKKRNPEHEKALTSRNSLMLFGKDG